MEVNELLGNTEGLEYPKNWINRNYTRNGINKGEGMKQAIINSIKISKAKARQRCSGDTNARGNKRAQGSNQIDGGSSEGTEIGSRSSRTSPEKVQETFEALRAHLQKEGLWLRDRGM